MEIIKFSLLFCAILNLIYNINSFETTSNSAYQFSDNKTTDNSTNYLGENEPTENSTNQLDENDTSSNTTYQLSDNEAEDLIDSLSNYDNNTIAKRCLFCKYGKPIASNVIFHITYR